MAVGVKIVARPGSLGQQAYLPAVAEGLGVTFKHFMKNFIGNVTGRRDKTDIVTIEYPEEKLKYPPRHRGLHRLMLRDDGQVRCVACMMCPTVCPAHCITIVPEEAPDGSIEKRPKIFEIDELRCVVCGLCAEACPCDAIRMDTLMHAEPSYQRHGGILDKEELMSRGIPSAATQGGVGAFWREREQGAPQSPPRAEVVPPGPPAGNVRPLLPAPGLKQES
jgi:NADH-quinone oxidoreductase subunit I